ncbi:hypothetical protein EDD21DRAFT_130361 [Dissophora ornata]|nr:hypothetical protein EDD21DRAFT_130361 [Dissophora ornata]
MGRSGSKMGPLPLSPLALMLLLLLGILAVLLLLTRLGSCLLASRPAFLAPLAPLALLLKRPPLFGFVSWSLETEEEGVTVAAVLIEETEGIEEMDAIEVLEDEEMVGIRDEEVENDFAFVLTVLVLGALAGAVGLVAMVAPLICCSGVRWRVLRTIGGVPGAVRVYEEKKKGGRIERRREEESGERSEQWMSEERQGALRRMQLLLHAKRE